MTPCPFAILTSWAGTPRASGALGLGSFGRLMLWPLSSPPLTEFSFGPVFVYFLRQLRQSFFQFPSPSFFPPLFGCFLDQRGYFTFLCRFAMLILHIFAPPPSKIQFSWTPSLFSGWHEFARHATESPLALLSLPRDREKPFLPLFFWFWISLKVLFPVG